MSGTVWRWQTLDRRQEIRDYGTTTLWGDPSDQHNSAQRWAADRMALLLYDVEPRYERLTGWRVRVWSDDLGFEVVADAEEWLTVLRGGPLARMRDRVEMLPSGGVRR